MKTLALSTLSGTALGGIAPLGNARAGTSIGTLKFGNIPPSLFEDPAIYNRRGRRRRAVTYTVSRRLASSPFFFTPPPLEFYLGAVVDLS